MAPRKKCEYLGGLALSLAASVACADRPLVSETADVIAPGDCQIEAAGARSRQARLPAGRIASAIFSCGLVRDTQLALAAARADTGGPSIDTATLAGKTNLVVPEGPQTGWGVAYSLGVQRADGAALRDDSLTLLGLATRELAAGLLGHLNIGWAYSRSARQSTSNWSLGVETTGATTVAADVFGDDRSRPTVSLGVGAGWSRQFSLNLAIAQQFESPRIRTWSLGGKLTF